MTESFIVPDAHGNWRLVLGLLEQEGLVENGYVDVRRIRKEVPVIQLGDFGNCVTGSINDDLEALRLVGPIVDLMLVGNHEHPYFGGPRFDGFAHYDELRRALLRLNDLDLIRAAHEVDGILLTHAGVTGDADAIDKWYGGGENKAAEMAHGLNTLWRNGDFGHGMFSAIGRSRGGLNALGSILWSDWSEPKCTLFPQIFGHTVGKTWRVGGTNGGPNFSLTPPNGRVPLQVQTLCMDIGAGKHSTKILGCWIRDGEAELVEYAAIS